MKPYKSQQSKKTTNSREYKILTTVPERYWDEGYRYHKSRGRWKWKKKQLLKYKVRLYRTWKYNRKTKWKSQIVNTPSSD